MLTRSYFKLMGALGILWAVLAALLVWRGTTSFFFTMPMSSGAWFAFAAMAYVVEVVAASLLALVARMLAEGLEFIVYAFAFLVPVLLIADWLLH